MLLMFEIEHILKPDLILLHHEVSRIWFDCDLSKGKFLSYLSQFTFKYIESY